MALINQLARIAAKMPYVVNKVRIFKHTRKWPRLKRPIEEMSALNHYIIQHSLENRSNPRWGVMADKYAVRQEVDRLLGPGYLIPLLGHWENPRDIDFDSLPKSFILKTNNGCGTNIFVHNKEAINRDEIIKTLEKSMAFPYSELSGQLHYAMIPPCVVAEEIIVQDGGHKSLTDYKIHCVNGEPITLYVFTDRDEVNHFDFTMKAYTADWKTIMPGQTPADVEDRLPAPNRPEWLDDMLDIARKLSKGEEYVRVDLYHTNGKFYFGEMTFTPDTAFHPVYHPYQNAMRYLLDLIKKQRRER